MPYFRPCFGCDRHVRSDELRCPFCDRELPAADRPPPAPSARLGRAALMAFGTVMATASLAGCKGDAPAAEAEENTTPVARPDTETRAAPAEEEKRREGSVEKADTAPIKSPFLVGSEPPNTAALAGDPPDSGRPPPLPPVQTVKRPPPPPPPPDWRHRNKAMPYGAPPADGLIEIV